MFTARCRPVDDRPFRRRLVGVWPVRRGPLRRRAATLLLCAVAALALLPPQSGAVNTAAAKGKPMAVADSAPDFAPALSHRRTLPELIGARPKVKQMITVSSSSFDSTSGTLKAWRRDPEGRWVLAYGPVAVVLGYNGWVKAIQRQQSTGTTPAGRFQLPYAFGNSADPGARLSYRHVDSNDWWPYEPRDPATYNVYQRHKAPRTRWRADYSERLAAYGEQYAYALVVGYNLPRGVHYSQVRHQLVARHPADTSRGGGIFLHVRGDGLTAGCVAMDRSDMRWLVRWVRPGADTRLVMGPHDYIITL